MLVIVPLFWKLLCQSTQGGEGRWTMGSRGMLRTIKLSLSIKNKAKDRKTEGAPSILTIAMAIWNALEL